MAALRQTFASSSRLTLHHLPTTSTPLYTYKFASTLAQTLSQPSRFDNIPSSTTYTAPVQESKGKERGSHIAPAPSTSRRKVDLKSKKAAISMTPSAISRLKALISSPTEPKLLRISVKSRGCAGMAYHLDYVSPPGGRFDEVVEQDGVKVLIDSKALFSIIGSRMDWRDNRLSAGFVFDK
uniref:Iron-sulfur cluster assembly protein n=1 Tax=Kwoniella pini CBS 10737 TaxID=1296096 RepID=A0A1B9I3S7_9TREE|nr:iron-sulfur cluster assembly protein [Kwoniella pini CBS 10737]OCF50184.1 iron-sulfur cluster assembly protein [Kwoniella pini CBS 10737]